MAEAPTRTRDRMLDGIRGYAIVLVLLSHSWTLAPTPDWTSVRWLFFSGDFAVTVFFVVSGFLATGGMLREVDRTGRLRPNVIWLRRWLRISAQVYVMVLVVLLASAATTSVRTAYEGTDAWGSARHIATYTWSGYVRKHAYEARPDFGHLWYVGTDLWGIAAILLVVYLLRRSRPALLAALVTLVVLITAYRYHVWHDEGAYTALIRVQTRADGLVWGAIAAVVLPWVRPLARYARSIQVCSALALVPLVGAVLDERDYLTSWGTVLSVDVAVLVLALSLTPAPAVLLRTLGTTPAVVVGRYSLVLYIWHYPLFWYVAKLDTDWSWQARTCLGYALTIVVAVVAHLLIERPTQRMLRANWWHEFDGGIWSGLVGVARRGREGTRDRVSAARHRNGSLPPDPPDPSADDTERHVAR